MKNLIQYFKDISSTLKELHKEHRWYIPMMILSFSTCDVWPLAVITIAIAVAIVVNYGSDD